MTPFKKILVATDFSPHATVALRLACDLARQSEAALCLVHAYDPLPFALPEGSSIYDVATLARLREDLTKHLAAVQGSVLELGVRQVETKLVEGQPYREIVRAAQEWGAQLIVTGTHGRTGMAHLLLGSVAERVARKAPCPVMVVPFVDARGPRAS
jgi:nucleotide-binding universal stress UspA family protein